MDDNFISIALKNLPKGKTGLSRSQGSSDNWEINSDGTFKIESYKTIQETETLKEFHIDSNNPNVSELINLTTQSNEQQTPIKRTIPKLPASKKQRIE